jgi:nucleotide-binding universal stress UspA family protein
MDDKTSAPPIVVGVSGSHASAAALRWAAEQARQRGAPLIAVHAWEPSSALRAPYAPAVACPTPEDDRVAAQLLLLGALAAAIPSDPDIEVHALLIEDRPVPALLRHTTDATLLALGHRLPPDGAPAPLGPVTRDCTAKSRCPVVTIPDTAPAARPEPAPAARQPSVVGHG